MNEKHIEITEATNIPYANPEITLLGSVDELTTYIFGVNQDAVRTRLF
jgi:hypothetical protein